MEDLWSKSSRVFLYLPISALCQFLQKAAPLTGTCVLYFFDPISHCKALLYSRRNQEAQERGCLQNKRDADDMESGFFRYSGNSGGFVRFSSAVLFLAIFDCYFYQEYPTYTILGQSQYQPYYSSSSFGVIAPADSSTESTTATTVYPSEKPNAMVPTQTAQRHSSGNDCDGEGASLKILCVLPAYVYIIPSNLVC